MVVTMNEYIRDYYMKAYPSDPYGTELNPDITFRDLLEGMMQGYDVYEMLGDGSDSLMRERVFERMSDVYGITYESIYELWLMSASYKNIMSDKIYNKKTTR